MRFLTIDIESYYDKDYSLSKLTTEEYIRDPRFEIIGVSVKDGRKPAQWFSGTADDTAQFVRSFDISNSAVLAHNCVTGDHEVRTPNGWVRFDALRDGTPVLQWSEERNELRFVVPEAVVRRHYTGEMLAWDSSYHKGVYTPEHRVVMRTPNIKPWRIETAEAVSGMGANNVYVPTSGNYTSDFELPMDAVTGRIMEMLRADANIRSEHCYARLHLSKSRKIARAQQLLLAAGWPHSTTVSAKTGNTTIALHACSQLERVISLLGRGKSKSYGAWVLDLPLDTRQAILDETQYWDGYKSSRSAGNRATCVASSTREDIYWLSEMATMSGWMAACRYDTPNTRGFSRADSVLHWVYLRNRNVAKTLYTPKRVAHDGPVFCVTVPSGAFLVRRNGATWVTGNCQFDGAILAWRLGLYPKMMVDTLSMARPIYGAVQSLSLAKLSEHLGVGVKGTEIVQALGKRRADFTADELAAYGGYCCNDAELCFKLFELLKPQTTDQELRLIDATLRLFTQPMLALDRPTLEAHLAAVLKRQAELLDVVAAFTVVQKGVEVGKLSDSQAGALRQRLVADPAVAKTLGGAHHELVRPALMSNPQFADLLRLAGVEPPIKISPLTGKEAYAFAKTDAGLTALLEHEDVLVQSLIAARLGVKSTIEQTRTERFLGIASRGTWPVDLNYAGADTTWRWSGGGKVNAQNLTRGGELRRAIMAMPGRAIVACDSANIELRVNHTLAGQESSVTAFRLGTDLYCEFASLLYGREITDTPENKAERFLGKLAHLSLGYGCGWKKFQEICRQKGVILSDKRAREIVDLWRTVYSRIPEQWARLDEAIKAMYHGSVVEIGKGLVLTFREEGVCGFWLPNNRRIRYYDLQPSADGWSYATRKGRRTIYGAKTDENLGQALARHIIADQWMDFNRWLKANAPRWRVVLLVHDEIVATGPKEDAERVAAALTKIMSTSPDWWPEIPLGAEAGIGERYGECGH